MISTFRKLTSQTPGDLKASASRYATLPLAFLCLLLSACTGCTQLNDERIPSMAVNIDLGNQGIWNTYGVHAYGQYNYFIFTNSIRQPAGFSYTYNSATGYGGVLLIGGQNVFSGDMAPLAYDLSCPVERLPDVRVYIDNNTLDAVCPDCDSHYNVVEANGAPISGPAESMHYALTPYQCYATISGGYVIAR